MLDGARTIDRKPTVGRTLGCGDVRRRSGASVESLEP